MGFFDQFFVTEGTSKAPTPTTKEVQVAPVPKISQADVNPAVVQAMWKLLEEKNLPGPDYMELKRDMNSLAAVPDEKQRVTLAFSVLKGQYPNITASIIISAIDTYKGFIEEEKKAGLQELEAAKKERIGDRNDKIEELKKKIEEYRKAIVNYESEKATLESEVTSATAELTEQEAKFMASIAAVQGMLDSDKLLIQNNIK